MAIAPALYKPHLRISGYVYLNVLQNYCEWPENDFASPLLPALHKLANVSSHNELISRETLRVLCLLAGCDWRVICDDCAPE